MSHHNGVPPWARPQADQDCVDLLGSILADHRRLPEAQALVTAADFAGCYTADLYRAIERCHADGAVPDAPAVRAALVDIGRWPAAEDEQDRVVEIMGRVVQHAVSAENIRYYARRVADMGRLRRRGHEIEDLYARVHRGDLTTDEVDERLAELAAGGTPTSDRYAVRSVTFAELGARARRPHWLVRPILIAGQPTIAGGARKVLKTSMLIDLAISLANRRQWLGQFAVPARRRVLLLSGESGDYTVFETALRVAHAKCEPGESPDSLLDNPGLRFDGTLPRLSADDQLAAVGRHIQEHGIEVVIFDPIYLCLLAGNATARASNLFDTGPLLANITRLCLDVGCTPVFAHHFTQFRKSGDRYDPPDLDELAFAGFAEFAREWLLIGRRERYEPGSGRHRLWLNVGGSAGFGSLWAIDIDEGVIGDDFGGRRWEVTVNDAASARQAAKDERQRQKLVELSAKVLDVLHKRPDGETLNVIAETAGANKDRVKAVLDPLSRQGVVELCDLTKLSGKCPRVYRGYRLKH